MARIYLGALLEVVQREIESRFHTDLVLEFETGPATREDLAKIHGDLMRQFEPFVRAYSVRQRSLWRTDVVAANGR